MPDYGARATRARDAAWRQFQPGNLNALYEMLLGQSGHNINAMFGQQAMQGQMAGRSAIAGLNRAGLGNTGLGAGLSAALQRGSAYEGNLLRAKMQEDLRGQAMQIAQGRSNIYLQEMAGWLNSQSAQAGKPKDKSWWQDIL